MGLLEYGYTTFMDFVYFVRMPISMRKKARLLYEYGKLDLQRLVFRARPKRLAFCGYTIPAFPFSYVSETFKEVFFRGTYWFPAMRTRPVIVECGANIGITTLFFTWLYRGCTVYSFEPDPAMYDQYTRTLEQNKIKRVIASQTAVADNEKDLVFFRGEETYGTGSLIEGRSASADKRIRVKATRLSTFIERELKGKRIDLLKIDIEGGELALVKDLARKGSFARVEQVIIEFHHNMGLPDDAFEQVLHALTSSGFATQCTATCIPIASRERPQDIMIYGYRRGR